LCGAGGTGEVVELHIVLPLLGLIVNAVAILVLVLIGQFVRANELSALRVIGLPPFVSEAAVILVTCLLALGLLGSMGGSAVRFLDAVKSLLNRET
jgi:hypothetical protein